MSFVYTHARLNVLRGSSGSFDLVNDTYKVCLVGSISEYNSINMQTMNGLLDEIDPSEWSSGPGGTARREITNKSLVVDEIRGIAKWDGDDVIWDPITPDKFVTAAIIYQHNDNADDSLNFPVAWLTPYSSGVFAGNTETYLRIQWWTLGIIQFETVLS